MKIRRIVSALGVVLFTVAMSCGDNGMEPTGIINPDYLVFGSFFGECFGEECVEIFKMEGGKLYEDTIDRFPTGSVPYEGTFVEIDDAEQNSVKRLIQSFPAALLDETDTVIGMPDAGDWGGWYLEVYESENNRLRYWLIDNMESNLPDYLHAFVDSMRNVRQRLSNQ